MIIQQNGQEKTYPFNGVEIESTDPKTNPKTNPKAAELILDLIRKDPRITKKELSEVTGLTESGVSYNIRKLRGEGKLDYIGSSKSGYWKVNDQSFVKERI